MDQLTSMRVFAAAAKLGSFSAAAEQLHISRAMASKHINNLEEKLDARLLNRTTRQLSLTEAGQVYYEKLQHILEEIEHANLSVSTLQTQTVGTLKVMSPPSFGSFHLSRALSDYKKQYPHVEIEMILTEAKPDLIEGGMDLAIHLGELKDANFIARKLNASRIVVCGSPDYFDKQGIPETPQDLNEHDCLRAIHQLPILDWTFKINNKTRHIDVKGMLTSNMADALRIAALNSCGLVQLPTYMVGLDIKAGRLIPVLQDYEPDELEIHAIYAHRKYLSTKVRTFIDHLQTYFKSPPYWDEWMY